MQKLWIKNIFMYRTLTIFIASLLIVAIFAISPPAGAEEELDPDVMHAEILDGDLFPSASKCKSCHEDI